MLQEFADLKGRTIVRVEHDREQFTMHLSTGTVARLLHYQDCCESVTLEEVIGDVGDLVGAPVLRAEEISSEGPEPDDARDETYTWTFYNIRTVKGAVTLRWYGTSNGYYSESVDFEWLERG